ncbi:hypothetical protein [Mycolicibacter sinensis]|uniref:Uncharacterized protein n=1 Tax=Mycolicibacter sinensis (strain JDM601) TaxID=875328 RepID=A0A1A2XTI7_MYCSD|nr:hypothetical protein [Mycolicibacter sinensis]OBI29054.1 hypothetical protein A5710_22655 [Mycolicibacter sinensis]
MDGIDNGARSEAESATEGLADDAADNAADIAAGRYVVASALNAAVDALQRAHRAAAVLASSRVHDAAFAEGHEGNAAIAFIADGQRFTRAALALAMQIITPTENSEKENNPG